MRYLICGVVLTLSALPLAQASTAPIDMEWEAAITIPCPPLLAEHECRAHHEILAKADEVERNTYLTTLSALLKEREKSCSCSVASRSGKR